MSAASLPRPAATKAAMARCPTTSASRRPRAGRSTWRPRAGRRWPGATTASSDTAWVLFVSPNYFSMMDAPVIAGQLTVARANGGAPAVVIGERFWREKLGAPSLAGLTLRLNDTDVNVAGVSCRARSPDRPASTRRMSGCRSMTWRCSASPAELQARETRWLFFLGRLARRPRMRPRCRGNSTRRRPPWRATGPIRIATAARASAC